ncbi:DUF1570 domain-containing protein [Botrimarina colliarenosi]|uniref:DUF1570 domain-containing protein n=1 Tax=Botrimarina colliarenosi TaxID=2528001 RepID=UPI0018D3B321|nr:DUF1570 domain-containing protein [Botrimarina colliarenosi]
MRLLLLLAALGAGPAGAADFMFEAVVGGTLLEGRPLAWTDATMTLLSRDGQLHEFPPSQAKSARRTAPHFRGYAVEEMRQRLYKEFGSRFDYASTGHYLVAHPRGERGVWADRFEALYRSFVRYFRVRNFSLEDPPYPLVAVVFGNRSEYERYVSGSSSGAPTGALGHYEPRTNRVYLYDQSTAGGDDRWDETAATVVHEATHQTAYNVGVHTRFAAGPRWVSEGLATMFEARGIHDAQSYDRGDSRVNRGRLLDFQSDVLPSQPLGSIETFIASDQSFQRLPILAYAEAWALTFFLSETRPLEYAEYLTVTAGRPLFSEYPAAERVADFRRVFGSDLKLLDAHFLSFVKGLR